MAKNIRTIQRTNTDKYDAGRILVPKELGFEAGDVILFEIIDQKSVKMTKIV